MADKIRDDALTALKDFYDWHASDTRWTARLDCIRDYIVYLEAYARIPAEEIVAEPVPDDPNGTDAAIAIETMTRNQLRDHAADNGIDLGDATKRDDMIAVIQQHIDNDPEIEAGHEG